jgi:predicted acetyltransferase
LLTDFTDGMSGLRLRPVRPGDEGVVRAAHAAMAAEGFGFALGLRDGMTFAGWLEALADDGAGLDFSPHDWVPASFLLAEVHGEVVGRTSVRHRLNEWLAMEGGHIGYGVLPGHRRRGYATEILRQSLVVAREHGVDRVLVTCDDDNVGSATVIERCGGVRDAELPTVGAPPKRRYWIE